MSQASIPARSASTPSDELYEVLADAGCLVVEGLASKETMGAVKTELAKIWLRSRQTRMILLRFTLVLLVE